MKNFNEIRKSNQSMQHTTFSSEDANDAEQQNNASQDNQQNQSNDPFDKDPFSDTDDITDPMNVPDDNQEQQNEQQQNVPQDNQEQQAQSNEPQANNQDNDEGTTSNKEIEIVYYLRLLDFAQLRKAKHAEVHEQWVIPIDKTENNAGEGFVRARKVTSPSKVQKHEICVKIKQDDGYLNNITRTSKEMFESVRVLSAEGMFKHRYSIPSDGVDWSIDVYPDGKGGFIPWARASFKCQEKPQTLPSPPLKVEEIITPNDQENPQVQEKIKLLYKNFFIINNPLLVENGDIIDKKPDEDIVKEEMQADKEPQPKPAQQPKDNDVANNDLINNNENTQDNSQEQQQNTSQDNQQNQQQNNANQDNQQNNAPSQNQPQNQPQNQSNDNDSFDDDGQFDF